MQRRERRAVKRNYTGKEKTQKGKSLKIGFVAVGSVITADLLKSLLRSGNTVTVWEKTFEELMNVQTSGCFQRIEGKEEYTKLTGGLLGQHGMFKYKDKEEEGRTVAKVYKLVKDPVGVAQESDVIVSCFRDPESLNQALHGTGGLLRKPYAGKGHIEMTTITPVMSLNLSKKIAANGGSYLELNCMISRFLSNTGKLFLQASGSKKLYEKCKNCFYGLAENIAFHGEKVGSAAKTNLLLHLMTSTQVTSLAENLTLAESSGVDVKVMLDILRISGYVSPYLLSKGYEMALKRYSMDVPLANMMDVLFLTQGTALNSIDSMSILSKTIGTFIRALRLGQGKNDISAVHKKPVFTG